MESGLDWLLFAALGLTAGTLSGLFGIGGGMVIVPGLFYLLNRMAVPHELLMHLAAGTSLCIMIFTSAASTYAHHLRGDVQWGIFRRTIAAIGFGVVVGNLLSSHLQTDWLELIFGGFLLFVAAKLLLGWKPSGGAPGTASALLTAVVGIAIGLKSGILGIGGGAISVPFLLYTGLPMSSASGTSASFTLPIAVMGTVSLLVLTGQAPTIPGATGYILWPAVAMVAPFTLIGAPVGAHLSHVLPSASLKTLFGAFLLFLGGRLLMGSLHHLWG